MLEAISGLLEDFNDNFNDVIEEDFKKELIENYKNFARDKKIFEDFIRDFFDYIRSEKYQYISASIKKHSCLFFSNDKTNHIAQAIHEIYTKGLYKSGSKTWHFIIKWIKEFNIGVNFEIICFEKEAYKLEITDFKNFKVNVSEMGTGTIQIMTIILNLALAINRVDREKTIPVLMIEEPEIALHPKHQSKLADLLFDAHTFGIHFFIETHSEYLIRKTQLIVKENSLGKNKSNNPFSVYYFDGINQPYKMNYREDGKFIEEFGSGFFDETRNIVKKMM